MTQTQGVIYVTKSGSSAGSSTTLALPKSALLFVGSAADEFQAHPWLDPFFVKRVWDQWVTIERFYDWRWEAQDTRRVGSVLVISKIHRVLMDKQSPLDAVSELSAVVRKRKMKFRYWSASCVVILVFGFWFVVLAKALELQLYGQDSIPVSPVTFWCAALVPTIMLIGVLLGRGVKALRKNKFLEQTLAHLAS